VTLLIAGKRPNLRIDLEKAHEEGKEFAVVGEGIVNCCWQIFTQRG
jgi:hypothetical protein